MLNSTLRRTPLFEGMFTVFCDIDSFHVLGYSKSTTMLVLTDEYIHEILGWEKVTDICGELRKSRMDLDIVLLGQQLKFDVPNTYTIKEDWQSPTTVSNTLSKIYSREKTISSNKFSRLYQDFKINSSRSDDFIAYIMANKTLSMNFLRELLENYNQNTMEMLSLRNKIETLMLENSGLADTVGKKDKTIDAIETAYNELFAQHGNLIQKINYQYNIPYDSEGEKGFRQSVINFDKVLYLKEFSRVKYTDTLMYYVQNIMNTVHQKHTRYIIIEPFGAYKASKLYPNHIPTSRLTHHALRHEDIVMVGYQTDIMMSILQNTAKHGFLIILDRTRTDYIYVKGDKVRPVYVFSDIADSEVMGVPHSNVLSYSHRSKYIPFIEGFQNMTVQEKLVAYSELPVLRELITALEV
jgi:cellobiose-specific phosphotransferase system component IIB